MLNRTNGINGDLVGAVAESYESIAEPIGIALGWERETTSTYLPQGKPVTVVHESGEASSIASSISLELGNWDRTSPKYVAIGALARNVTPTTIAQALDMVSDPRLAVLRGDHYFTLMREAAAPGATPVASPVASGGTVR